MPLKPVSDKIIGRISLYRSLLGELAAGGVENLYSHELATRSGNTAVQVRRDLMTIGFTGSPSKGYRVGDLIVKISEFLDTPGGQKVALVGVGNLGRALLAHLPLRHPSLRIVVAFDSDPSKAGRVIQGCRVHPMEDLESVFTREGIRIGLITVPAAAARAVADRMVRAGATGLMNFARVPLHAPPHVYVETIDMTMSLEKVAYYARQRSDERDKAK